MPYAEKPARRRIGAEVSTLPLTIASSQRLASISRELAFNDPDAENGEDGHDDARGGDGDRNVELIVRDPR